MTRKGLAAAIMLAVSVALGLGAAEGVVRLLRPQFAMGPDPIRNPFWMYDPEIGWLHRPSVTGTFARQEFSHQVHINAAGWRDRERSLEKPAGAFRILVLGDSFTWGHGVEDDQIYTRRLEGLLPGVEVLNMGLSASATDQQLLILRRFGLAYHPDLVLVMVSRNDFTANTQTNEGSYHKPMFVLDPEGALRLTNVPVPEVSPLARLHYRLRRRSALLNMLESIWDDEAGDPDAIRARRSLSYDVTSALLRAMKDEANRSGASFAAALAPSNAHTYLDPIPPLEARKFQVVLDLGAREGFPVLDLVPAFRDAAREGGRRVDLHYRLDQHWNAAGHEVAARELAELLRRNGLIPVGAAKPRL